eukprot:CAMPEP_0202968176 /NCGR_PEP_ID=MMETSP1396-20130829/13356_1 /ASSEMBLY_ACC=CAM_ASM_000872 /TAXON_ID= /ORGANISM="Pseudokeronopsis sp., Strain Brazil" /LENGTH=103 /DNA_ID=CAMNT_0049694173 /DNA_START=161 /DNA_END=472 /DNA_ORIENTATION=+
MQGMSKFIEGNLNTFLGAIASNLGSTNPQVKKASELALRRLSDIIDKQVLIAPLANLVLFGSNSRSKPALIELIAELVSEGQKTSLIMKVVVPLAYKLIDENK